MKKLYIITVLLLAVSMVFGQTKSDLQFIEQTLNQRDEVVIRFPHNNNRELVSELSHIISIDKVTDTYVQAYANRTEYERFKTYSVEHEPVYEYYTQTRALNMATTVEQMANWDRYPTYAVYLELMRSYVTNYPTLCKMDTVGYSVNNRPIITMIISDNVGVDEDEPEFWWSSTMHGDETTGWYFMMRLVDYLLTNYGTDPQATRLVNEMEIYISPDTNPDGTFYQSNDGTSIANARRYNQNSVDLNRNFPPISGTVESGNQPEITMMTAYASAHNFVMAANGHGGTECLNYPWDQQNWYSASHPHPDTDWWLYICQQYADTCHALNSSYLTGPGSMNSGGNNSTGITQGCDWYYTQGGRQDYMNYYQHCKEITMEWSDTKELGTEYLNTYWGYNKQAILNYTEQALFGFRGIVTDGCTNQPLSDVKVFINNHDADNSEVYTAAPIGDYHRPIYAGTYSVTFSKDGYTSQTFNVTTQNQQSVRLDVVLYPEGTVVPEFTANPTTLYEGNSVQFANTTSGNYVSASWTFDGGSPATSTATNPTVTYSTHGTYDATLTIVNTNGCSSSTTEQITVYEAVPPVADFSASETQITAGNSVTFTDLSTNMPTSWSWTFEGGTPATSNLQNPTVTYSEPGEYTVTLVASNAFGSDTETKTEYISVAAVYNMSNEAIYVCNGTYKDPGGDSNYPNNANYTQTIYPSTEGAYVRLNFTSFSLQAASGWYSTCSDLFYIYDGTSTSATALVNGVCGTNNPGTVTATNADGALTIVFTSNNTTNAAGWEAEISCYMPEPEAIFTAEITENCTRNIATTNESEYATSYLWAFGDGTTSTETAPTHTYAENGTYTITLTASNANGSSTATQQIEVEIPEVTSVTNANGCGNATLTLSAQGNGTLHWFDAQTGGTELGTGDSYTNAFAETTTVYVESQIGSEETYNVGIADNSSATAYTQSQTRGLTFTVSQALTLVSVDVYCSQNNQSKTITITNSSNQTVHTSTHTLASGLNTLTLNAELEPGTYNITTNVRYTYRQTTSFPYTVDNVISITGQYNYTYGTQYYYTFYNWVVKTGSTCTSERTPVTATISESGSIDLGEPITQCGGTATIDAGNGFNSYTWSNGQTTQSITVSQSGTYSVTASNGQCEVTATRVVTINPVPSVSITESNDVLTANATSGSGNYSYLWSEGNATTQSIDMTHNGNYCVTVSDSNGCQASDCIDATMDDIEIIIADTEHGSISGETSVEYDGNYTFTVTPDNCYEIASVTINGTEVALDANNSYTINNVTAPQSISATFSPITYTITATAGNGGNITPGTSNVNCGDNITFTITPDDGYMIADLLVDGQSTGSESSYTFSDVTANHTISATFEPIPAGEVVIVVNTDGEGGSVTPNGTQTITEGNDFTFTVTPDACYEIGIVTVNGNEVSLDENNSYTIENVSEPQNINATFNRLSYIITASANEGGTITPSGNVEVNCGDNKEFVITANEGYEIENVVVDGQSQGAITSYTFENVTENGHSIEATFNEIIVVPECNAVTNLTAQVESYGVVLSWNATENAISYDIYRNGERIATETNTSAIDLQGHEGDSYYIITNCANGGTSDASETITATAEPTCNAITNLTARVESYGIVLSWEAAENAVSYDIYCNGNRISTASTTSYIDLQGHEGDTYYIITNCANGGTSDASESATATITGIDETASSISVYPNPASDIVTISADEAIKHFEIVSITGQTLRTEEVNSDRIECNIESIPAGTYLIRIFGNTNVYVKKLVIK